MVISGSQYPSGNYWSKKASKYWMFILIVRIIRDFTHTRMYLTPHTWEWYLYVYNTALDCIFPSVHRT